MQISGYHFYNILLRDHSACLTEKPFLCMHGLIIAHGNEQATCMKYRAARTGQEPKSSKEPGAAKAPQCELLKVSSSVPAIPSS